MTFLLQQKYVITDEKRAPWAGAAVGIVLGIVIAIADQMLTKTPTIKVIYKTVVLYFNEINFL